MGHPGRKGKADGMEKKRDEGAGMHICKVTGCRTQGGIRPGLSPFTLFTPIAPTARNIAPFSAELPQLWEGMSPLTGQGECCQALTTEGSGTKTKQKAPTEKRTWSLADLGRRGSTPLTQEQTGMPGPWRGPCREGTWGRGCRRRSSHGVEIR